MTYVSIQIPRQNRHRVWVFRTAIPEGAGSYEAMEDFVWESVVPPSFEFAIEVAQLVYLNEDTKAVVRRTLLKEQFPILSGR